MAFSAKDHNIADKGRVSTLDSSHNPGNNMFTYASFFKDIHNQKRTPFEVTPSIDDNGQSFGKALDFTFTFVEANDDFSFIIDCSQFVGMVFKGKTLPTCLREQYPKGLGIRHRMVSKNHKVIEMNFPTEQDCMEALGKEFTLQGKSIQVNKALDRNANVVRVTVSAIPYKPVDFLKPLLIKTFEKYGDILNVGLCHSKDGDWFTGRGFVTLNLDKTKQYEAELTPQITFGDFKEKIRLVWTNMQPICRQCHTDDHVLADCPRTRKKACHKCGSYEHLIRMCPKLGRNQKQATSTQEHRRESVTKESNQSSTTTRREINLFDLMKVPQPHYLPQKKGGDSVEEAMLLDDDTTAPTTPTRTPDDSSEHVGSETETPLPQEAITSTVTSTATDLDIETTVEPTTTVESHQEKSIDAVEPNTQEEQHISHHISEESEYEAGETSESSVEYHFRDRYNLGKSKKKPLSTSTAGDAVKEASQKRSIWDLASTPPGSDQEGSSKKVFKQHEDTQMGGDEQGNSSTTKSL